MVEKTNLSHKAEELLTTMMGTKAQMKRKSGGNAGVVGFALLVGSAFFSIPFLAHFTKVGWS